jgi:nucleoside-diphosphate-sugar epimerase
LIRNQLQKTTADMKRNLERSSHKMTKKIVITGAGGFLGGHLIEGLVHESVEIKAIDLRVPDTVMSDKVKWVACDLLKDDLTAIVKDADIVYHLAGKYIAGDSKEILDDLNTLNVIGTENIAKAASSAGVEKIVHISSISACEDSSERIITEESGKPVTSYGFSKLASEKALIANLTGQTKYIVVRPVAFFGENHEGSVYELVKAIKSRRFFLIGNGKNNVNFLYVKDLVNYLIEFGMDDGIDNEIFIVSGEPLQLKALVDAIKKELGLNATRFCVPKFIGLFLGYILDKISKRFSIRFPLSLNRAKAMAKDKYYSNYKIKKYLGGCRYGVMQGLRSTIAWYKATNLL